MPDYRHNRVPGRSYFFTVRLADPHSRLLTEHISALGEAIRQARARRPFHIDAWVVLHSHVHSIWTLPPGDHDHASRWRAIKIAFSKAARGGPHRAVWHRRYQQHPVEGDAEYQRLVDYVHGNPVSHGLCRQAHEWPWSSVHRFRVAGWIDRA